MDTPQIPIEQESLQHELDLAKKENRLAAEHALDLIDNNKFLNEKILKLQNQIDDITEDYNSLNTEKDQLETHLETVKQQKKTVEDLGHDREKRMTNEIKRLETALSNSSHGNFSESNSFLLDEVNKENDQLSESINELNQHIRILSEKNSNLEKENNDLQKREETMLDEMEKLETDNIEAQEQMLIFDEKLSELSNVENELEAIRLHNESYRIEIEQLTEKLFLKEEELKEAMHGVERERALKLAAEKKSKKLKGKLTKRHLLKNGLEMPYVEMSTDMEDSLPSSVPNNLQGTPQIPVTANSLFLDNLPTPCLEVSDNESIPSSPGTARLSNPSHESTPQFKSSKPTFKKPSFGRKGNLEYELQCDNLRSQVKDLEDAKAILVEETERREKEWKQQLEALQKTLSNSQDLNSEFKTRLEEYSKVQQILSVYEVSPENLGARLDQSKNESIDQNSSDKENAKPQEGDSSATTAKKLRKILKTQEEQKNQQLKTAKLNYDKMLKIKQEIIQKLTEEIRSRRQKEREFKLIKKEFITKTENWKSVLQMLASQVKEKESELLAVRKKLRMVVTQKNRLDDILADKGRIEIKRVNIEPVRNEV